MQQHADSTLTPPNKQWISHDSLHRSKPYTAFSFPTIESTSSKPITAFSELKQHSHSTKHHKSRSKRPHEPLARHSSLPPLPPPNYPPPPPPPPADTLLAGIWQHPSQPAAKPSATHASATSTAARASSPSPGTTSDDSSLHVEVKTEYAETRPRDSG